MSEHTPHDPTRTAGARLSTKEVAIPELNALLQDAAKLNEVIVSPQVLFTQASEQTGEDTNHLEDQILALRSAALVEIVAPEGLAKASRTAAERLARDAEPMLGIAARGLEQSETILQRALGEAVSMTENMRGVRLGLQKIRDDQSRGQLPQDLDSIRYAINPLQAFRDQYTETQRLLTSGYSEAASETASTARYLQQTEDEARRAQGGLREVESAAANNPANMYFDGVEAAVVDRGLSSTDQHRDQCEAEANISKDLIQETRQGVDGLIGRVNRIRAGFSRADAISGLPLPDNFGYAVDQLSSSLNRTLEYGKEMQGAVQQSLDEVERMIKVIEAGMNTVTQEGRKDLEAVGQTKQNIQDLRHKLQSVAR